MRQLLRYLAGRTLPWRVRRPLLAASGVRVGDGAYVAQRVTLEGGPIRLGADAYLNREVLIDATGPVDVGPRVSIGPRVTILANDHDLGDSTARAGTFKAGSVTIGAGTWVGAHAVIFGNVIIGEGCIVAAGSVVKDDLPAHGVYAGSPARLIKELQP